VPSTTNTSAGELTRRSEISRKTASLGPQERHPLAMASTGSTVISMRIDAELLDRLRGHAAKRGMSVQDYIVRTLIRDDFDQRLQSSVEETERLGR
jgi:hypothetical protein